MNYRHQNLLLPGGGWAQEPGAQARAAHGRSSVLGSWRNGEPWGFGQRRARLTVFRVQGAQQCVAGSQPGGTRRRSGPTGKERSSVQPQREASELCR